MLLVSPDELENPYEDESSKLSFESLFCSHELELHPPARRYLTFDFFFEHKSRW